MKKTRFSIDDLIINFWRITFVHGAKHIYFSRRIRIRKQNVDSITSARAMRARKQQKTRKFAFLVGRPEISASLARAEARAGQKFFQIQIQLPFFVVKTSFMVQKSSTFYAKFESAKIFDPRALPRALGP